MSLRLASAAAELENLDEFHLARLLVLLRSEDQRRRKDKTIEGITKLAKLDFLLRYPTSLERALTVRGKSPADARVHPRERMSVEAKMIRFRYGPWDDRYRRWLGLLMARGLVDLGVKGNTVQIGLTELGRVVADEIRSDPNFLDIARRSDLLSKVVGGMSATKLKDFVYEIVPEIVDLKWGEEISATQLV